MPFSLTVSVKQILAKSTELNFYCVVLGRLRLFDILLKSTFNKTNIKIYDYQRMWRASVSFGKTTLDFPQSRSNSCLDSWRESSICTMAWKFFSTLARNRGSRKHVNTNFEGTDSDLDHRFLIITYYAMFVKVHLFMACFSSYQLLFTISSVHSLKIPHQTTRGNIFNERSFDIRQA